MSGGKSDSSQQKSHIVYSKMAPKKGKNQVKRNNIKIKSKTNPQKRGLKRVKSRKLEEKPVDNLKWYNKSQGEENLQRIDTGVDWLNGNPYKKDFASSTSSEADSSGYIDYTKKGIEYKSCFSDDSDECNCNYDKYPESKYGILKRKVSSTNSLVAKYIKSGMDHVASFIVESAIRFGEQHGVVVPDRNTPNVYEITPPDDKRFFDEKCRRIRFKIPEKSLGYEEAKKLIWRNQTRNLPDSHRKALKAAIEYDVPSHSTRDSLHEIIPLLEKLKKGESKRNELEFKKIESSMEREHTPVPPIERERKRQRDQDKSRDREMERDRIREMEMDRERGRDAEKERRRDVERVRGRERQRARERIKKRIRAMERFKSVGAESEEKAEIPEYSRRPWKKFRQDSLELGRQRLRASTCPRKSNELSQTPTY